MARTFVAASSQWLIGTTPATNVLPITMSCWLKPTSFATAQSFFGVDTAGAVPWLRLGAEANASCYCQHYDGTNQGDSIAAATLSLNTWAHLAGIFLTTSSRTSYLNGVVSPVNTVSVAGVTATRAVVGQIINLVPANAVIAECAMWNIALSAADMLQLAAGVSPLHVRPDALIYFAPLYGLGTPEPEFVGRRSLTVTGATAALHPTIYAPSSFDVASLPAFVPPAGSSQPGRMFGVF